MPIQVQCPTCNRQASVPDNALGRSVRCGCGQQFIVSAPQPNPAKASSSGDDLLALQPLPSSQSASANARPEAPQYHNQMRSSRSTRMSGDEAEPRSNSTLYVGIAASVAIVILVVAGVNMLRGSGTGEAQPQTASVAPSAAKPAAAPSGDSAAEADRKKREQQAVDEAKRKADADKARLAGEERKRQDEERAAKQKHDDEVARRRDYADLVTTLAKAATVESTSEESVQEKVVSQERVYFPGFNTPAHSAEENMARQQQIYSQYPYADGQRRYKIVEKKTSEKVQRIFLHIAIRNTSAKFDLANMLVVATNDDKDFETLDFDPSKEYAIQTGPLRAGQTFENRFPTAFPTKNAYVIIDAGTGGFAAAKINGATLSEYAHGETVFEKFRKLSADRAAKAEGIAEKNAANAWRSNRDEVAARFVKHLVDDGIVISAKRGDRADIGNLLNYVFVFEDRGGLQRTYRNGSVDLEEYGGEWIVRRSTIDGTERIENWPDK